ncbi:MAG: hypothetical protein ABI925_09045 [Verrucomicrobiota bacterium]
MTLLINKTRRRRIIATLGMAIFLGLILPAARSQGISPATEALTPSPTIAPENPFAKLAQPSRKPIPLRWKVAIVLTALVIAAAALWFSIRVWQSSNLFDRQYRFAAVPTAAIRLGANRSGGHMATITFRNRNGPSSGT